MITQSVSQEERASGIKGNILGNSKVFLTKSSESQDPPQPQYQTPPAQPNAAPVMPPMPDEQDEDDIPF